MKSIAVYVAALMLSTWPGGDAAVKPGTDFFSYANGGWIAANPIPPDRSGFSIATIVSRQADDRVRDIVAGAARGVALEPSDERGKIGAYYAAFMDEARLDRLGGRPLGKALKRIEQATDRVALARIMGSANRGHQSSLTALTIEPDSRDADHNVLYIHQRGLGSLNRNFYLASDSARLRLAYREYAEHLLALVGVQRRSEAIDAAIAFERQIAKASSTAAEDRDDARTYNPSTIGDLDREAPGFPWAAYFAAAGVVGNQRVIIVDRAAIPAIAHLFAITPLAVLKTWAAFHLADNAAPFLSRGFVQAHFDFHGRQMAGQQAPPPRWRDAIRLVSGGGWRDMENSRGSMGDAVGRLYTARWFDQRSHDELHALVVHLQDALKARIEASEWMAPATRAEALRKVADVRVEIGIPAHGDEYAGLSIRRDDLFGDVERATDHAWRADLDRLHSPVDRSRWTITPQTVNAYNYAPFNEVVFTAALLQPPAFHATQDIAFTYGGIGAIIGHELTHGFDDVGRRFDAAGHRRDWWAPDDAKRFESKANSLTRRYSACQAMPGMHVDGKLTLGENIADIGGLQLAYAAYRAALAGKSAPVIDGLTGDQRFFLGFAMLRRGHRRDDALRSDVRNDPHTPDRCRVNEVVREVDAWYGAFHVAPGDVLYVPPRDRVGFW